ncbi:MAG: propionyl-CoA carboxylase alpha chain [Candidatus Azotimanducaceae bacterium]|jgi:propionyl-CoA carboxylase alpha chain
MANVERTSNSEMNIKPVNTLLVANRGEIARRIMRTARDMGIVTVAVYADGDALAPFVLEADSAIALNGRTSAETYLVIDKIISAGERSGADAIHPGYGFLSENATFASAVIEAGITWVGPTPDVISAMGDKLSAKALMTKAGVPTLPGIEIKPETDLSKAAESIGYPVLIKASAGGGGRGMRIVATESQLKEAVESAKREAKGAFGDDTVFLEKWLDHARHIEIQIMGDNHGNLVHCFERECSIQRRHQKIIEEAPSSAVTPKLRDAMGKAALDAAGSLGYSSAGTVEFMLSGEDFYFLEVNARLQVEHPVTEAIIGRDLVREQIRIAEGERLSFNQSDLSINGHAIEARLCAEDPENDFLPSPGRVVAWAPSTVAHARYDSGIESGNLVAPEFDPMLVKVIVHAPTRREAAARLARALETTTIQGLTTNRDFLTATLRHPEFLSGNTTTDFISRCTPQRARRLSQSELFEAATAVVIESQAINRASASVMNSVRSGWRNSTLPYEAITFSSKAIQKEGADESAKESEETTTQKDLELNVKYRSRRDGKFKVRINDSDEMLVSVFDAGRAHVDIEIDGARVMLGVLRDVALKNVTTWLVHSSRGDLSLIEQPRYPALSNQEQPGGLVAPMPGVVLASEIEPGQFVNQGALLIVLEAMKMEHRITAPHDGTVTAVHVTVGDQVENDQLLVSLEKNVSVEKPDASQ